MSASPWLWLSRIQLDAAYGKDVDFALARPGHGGQVTFTSTVRPMNHLAIDLIADRRWLDVDDGTGTGDEDRLFTAKVERIRATYTFTSRCFTRVIGQRVATRRDPALYPGLTVPDKVVDLSYSVLFAYKLNWQSVLFVGYGAQDLNLPPPDGTGDLERSGQQLFLKLSYAFQL